MSSSDEDSEGFEDTLPTGEVGDSDEESEDLTEGSSDGEGSSEESSEEDLTAGSAKDFDGTADMGDTLNSADMGEDNSAAAVKMQSMYRSHAVRQDIRKQNISAQRIQSVHRGRRGRQQAVSVRQRGRDERQAATRIQAAVRGCAGRAEATRMAASEQLPASPDAAIDLLQRALAFALEGDDDFADDDSPASADAHNAQSARCGVREQDAAAMRIQAADRGQRGRAEASRLRDAVLVSKESSRADETGFQPDNSQTREERTDVHFGAPVGGGFVFGSDPGNDAMTNSGFDVAADLINGAVSDRMGWHAGPPGSGTQQVAHEASEPAGPGSYLFGDTSAALDFLQAAVVDVLEMNNTVEEQEEAVQADAEVVVAVTGLSQEEVGHVLQDVFMGHDGDGDGVLDQVEFGRCMVQLGSQLKLGKSVVRQLFMSCDTNRDNVIEWSDFVGVALRVILASYQQAAAVEGAVAARAEEDRAALRQRARDILLFNQSQEELQQALVTAFNAVDTDGSGQLDALEFRRIVHGIGWGLTDGEANYLMYEMDSNGDGQISLEEFAPVAFEMVVEAMVEMHHDLDALQRERDGQVVVQQSSEEQQAAEQASAQASSDVASNYTGLTPEEVGGVLQDVFMAHDVDGDGALDQGEFGRCMIDLGGRMKLDKAVVRQLFMLIDANGDGLLDWGEFVGVALRVIVTNMQQASQPQEQLGDADLSARAEEDRAALRQRARDILLFNQSQEELQQALVTAFNAVDTDGSGQLDALEFRRIVHGIGWGLTDGEANYLMYEMDSNGDGQISLEEFAPVAFEMVVEAMVEMDHDFEIQLAEERLAAAHEQAKALVNSLTPEEVGGVLQDVFMAHDVDGDGALNQGEFGRFIVDAGGRLKLDKAVVRQLFMSCNANGDDFIEWSEFVGVALRVIIADMQKVSKQEEDADEADLVARVQENGALRQRARNNLLASQSQEELQQALVTAFNAVDTDGSGQLDALEFRRIVHGIGWGLTDGEANYLMYEMDSNGDGQISLEEFAPVAFEMVVEAMVEMHHDFVADEMAAGQVAAEAAQLLRSPGQLRGGLNGNKQQQQQQAVHGVRRNVQLSPMGSEKSGVSGSVHWDVYDERGHQRQQQQHGQRQQQRRGGGGPCGAPPGQRSPTPFLIRVHVDGVREGFYDEVDVTAMSSFRELLIALNNIQQLNTNWQPYYRNQDGSLIRLRKDMSQNQWRSFLSVVDQLELKRKGCTTVEQQQGPDRALPNIHGQAAAAHRSPNPRGGGKAALQRGLDEDVHSEVGYSMEPYNMAGASGSAYETRSVPEDPGLAAQELYAHQQREEDEIMMAMAEPNPMRHAQQGAGPQYRAGKNAAAMGARGGPKKNGGSSPGMHRIELLPAIVQYQKPIAAKPAVRRYKTVAKKSEVEDLLFQDPGGRRDGRGNARKNIKKESQARQIKRGVFTYA